MEAIYSWQHAYAHLPVSVQLSPSPLNFSVLLVRCFSRIFSLRQLVLLVCHPGASLAFLPVER